MFRRGEKGYPARPSIGYRDGVDRDRQVMKAAKANGVSVDTLEHFFMTGERTSKPKSALKRAIDDEVLTDEF